MSQKLAGKVALVTGASRGIGAAIAMRLAEDGASVALTYSSSAPKAEEVVKAIEAAGGKAIAIKADSSDEAAVKKAFDETAKKFGKIDILVNNAGLGLYGPLADFSMADFDRLVAVNIRGIYLAIREAAARMGEGGRIINIGSCLADRVPFPGTGAYSMTKAAVAGLTRSLARELGPSGITINNVQPGPIDTEMNPADGPQADLMHSHLAIARHGHGHEIASMVAYLALPETAYITGANFTVDGGFAA